MRYKLRLKGVIPVVDGSAGWDPGEAESIGGKWKVSIRIEKHQYVPPELANPLNLQVEWQPGLADNSTSIY